MKTTHLKPFVAIQEAIHQYSSNEYLLISDIDGGLYIDFYSSYSDGYNDLLKVLCKKNIAPYIKQMRFHSPDVGANGTRDWQFYPILSKQVSFPNLTHLFIELYDGYGHNHPIVSDVFKPYAENGTLAQWLDKAPNLIHLTTPSAPNSDFFKRDSHPLQIFDIQAGYDTQNFILNLSESRCFSDLRVLRYRDFDETYISDYQKNCTPLTHFHTLFQSPLFDTIRLFVWFNPIFSDDELKQLKALRPQLSFKVVRFSADWIR